MMGGLCSQLAVLLLLLVLPSPAHGAEESQDQPVFSRIIGGQDAKKGNWPWQVSVQKYDKREYNHICGGSLISAQWVVSAAHCFNLSVSPSQYRVVLGAHQLLPLSPKPVLAELQQIIPHPRYNRTSFVADIALVRLKKPVKSTFIQPISLPGASRQFRVGKNCWVTGWGRVEVTKPLQPPKTLQQLEVPILNSTTCNDRYNTLKPKPEPFLGPQAVKTSMICAGYMDSNKGFCKGDSGGPLACEQNNTWYLAGVVSWFMTRNVSGIVCSHPKFPGVFTQVTAYDSWIQGHVNGVGPSAVTSPAALTLAALLLTAL